MHSLHSTCTADCSTCTVPVLLSLHVILFLPSIWTVTRLCSHKLLSLASVLLVNKVSVNINCFSVPIFWLKYAIPYGITAKIRISCSEAVTVNGYKLSIIKHLSSVNGNSWIAFLSKASVLLEKIKKRSLGVFLWVYSSDQNGLFSPSKGYFVAIIGDR